MTVDSKDIAALSVCGEKADSLRDLERLVQEARDAMDGSIVAAREAGWSVDEIAEAAAYSRQLVSKATRRFAER